MAFERRTEDARTAGIRAGDQKPAKPWNALERALCSFLKGAPLEQLARMLTYASETGRISYQEAEKAIGDDPDDALFTAYEQRMLIPERSSKGTMEWDDAVFLCQPGEWYRMPNVVRFLTAEAERTGQWRIEQAVRQLFREMGEPDWDRISELVRALGKRANHHRINAEEISEACRELELEDRVDTMIAELKGSGVMSPKLGSMAETLTLKSPLYELNPCLFMERESPKIERPKADG